MTLAYVDFGVIWQSGKSLVQSLVHLLWRALEKASAACQSVRELPTMGRQTQEQ